MKTIAVVALVATATFAAAAAVQDMPRPEPTDQHTWLKQLVGEWSVTSTAHMGPDVEPMKMDFTDSTRALGDLWILGEGSAQFGEMPFSSMMTLGYDPAKKAFVGTWIDSMQTHLWLYEGQLDESRKVLTLSTKGPSFDDPAKMADYRDTITIVSADKRTLTSAVKGEDGQWNEFMQAEYTRKKP